LIDKLISCHTFLQRKRPVLLKGYFIRSTHAR
jgi:hypothetical protein